MRYILTKLIRRRSETVEGEKKTYMKIVYNKTYKILNFAFSSEILKTSSYLLMHFISTSRASNASRSVELTVIMLFFPPIPSSTEGKVGSNVQSPSTTNLY